MTKKTIQEIQAEHSAKGSGILTGYHDELNRVREMRTPEAGAYLNRLSDQQRMNLLYEQKREQANAAYARAVEEYDREVSRYQTELAPRVAHVEGALFGMSSPESAATLSRAALASEEELGVMLDLAATSGNRELATAALVGAERRGFAGLTVRALEAVGDEVRGVYHEWRERPTPEMLERQRESVGTVVQPPDHDWLAGVPPLDR